MEETLKGLCILIIFQRRTWVCQIKQSIFFKVGRQDKNQGLFDCHQSFMIFTFLCLCTCLMLKCMVLTWSLFIPHYLAQLSHAKAFLSLLPLSTWRSPFNFSFWQNMCLYLYLCIYYLSKYLPSVYIYLYLSYVCLYACLFTFLFVLIYLNSGRNGTVS